MRLVGFTWFKDFDYDALVVGGVDTFVDFGVFATADLFNDLVVVLRAGGKGEVSGVGDVLTRI